MSNQIENTSPTTYIKPSRSWLNFDLKDFWAYRELLYFLAWRDVKVRYKQTAIGVIWAILQPVLTTAIFTIIFTQFARLDSIEVAYPLFALSGILLWIFVSAAITASGNSLISNSNLVTKIYFPRLIVPVSATIAGLIDFALGFTVALGLMFYYGVNFTWQILLAPFFVALAIALALSFGTFFAALNVRFRDVKHALPFALQIWMFASPIFYPASVLSGKWQILIIFNPLAGILGGFRSALFGLPFEWFSIAVSVILTSLAAFVALIVFSRMEDDFADYI